MGMVVCPQHGKVPGILSCPEVSDATWRGVSPPRHYAAHVDCSEEAPSVKTLIFIVCDACATAFNLGPGRDVSWERFWDESHMPNLAPACPHCLGQGV
jgi:hypothetical protein